MITGKTKGSFSDYFDIESQNIDTLVIKETYNAAKSHPHCLAALAAHIQSQSKSVLSFV